MELNIWTAMNDKLYKSELAAIAIYGQAISKPYMRAVRARNTNYLSLKTLHRNIVLHCQKIIADPALVVGPDASHVTGALDGKLSMTSLLPSLRVPSRHGCDL